jgi:hypothetical protein
MTTTHYGLVDSAATDPTDCTLTRLGAITLDAAARAHSDAAQSLAAGRVLDLVEMEAPATDEDGERTDAPCRTIYTARHAGTWDHIDAQGYRQPGDGTVGLVVCEDGGIVQTNGDPVECENLYADVDVLIGDAEEAVHCEYVATTSQGAGFLLGRGDELDYSSHASIWRDSEGQWRAEDAA